MREREKDEDAMMAAVAGVDRQRYAGLTYLANTFSPLMLGQDVIANVQEVGLDTIQENLDGAQSVISHEITAKVLSAMLGREIPFNRVNLSLRGKDILLVVVPNFRANEAREFTREEVGSAGMRCFIVNCK